jgi:hypothetical protein
MPLTLLARAAVLLRPVTVTIIIIANRIESTAVAAAVVGNLCSIIIHPA